MMTMRTIQHALKRQSKLKKTFHAHQRLSKRLYRQSARDVVKRMFNNTKQKNLICLIHCRFSLAAVWFHLVPELCRISTKLWTTIVKIPSMQLTVRICRRQIMTKLVWSIRNELHLCVQRKIRNHPKRLRSLSRVHGRQKLRYVILISLIIKSILISVFCILE